jgi:hypothetical protein
MSITDAYLEAIEGVARMTKAGFLGLHLAEGLEEIDRDDLASGEGPPMPLGFKLLATDDPDLELLARVSLLATDADEFTAEDIENIPLPADATARKKVTEMIRNFSADLSKMQSRVLEIMEEIDEIVAAGLGLTPAEHDTIRKRCQEFPLSITVERPRFAWSPDRKRQARRTYRPGERFK